VLRREFLAAAALPSSLAAAKRAKRVDLAYSGNPLDVSAPLGYFIDQPAGSRLGVAKDKALARWALEAWDHSVRGLFCFHPADASQAAVRVYWGQIPNGLGRMQSIELHGRRAGEVYVETEPARFSAELGERCAADPLFRSAFVYLTALHEIGHALGLDHSLDMNDAMYFGGDVMGFYGLYCSRLASWEDIRRHSGLSPADLERVRALYSRWMD
jgi:hypothetical protein